MIFDKDLGFADRFILIDTPTLKITKLLYKGGLANLGEETITRVYDTEGNILEEAHIFNGSKGNVTVAR
ncbi:MAG: hypothetical protein RR394_02780 [Oscillospiraceae bacterium]